MLQVLLLDLCQVLLDVRERVRYVFLSPDAGVKEDVNDGLFLDEHLVTLILDSLGDARSLAEIDTVRWRPPVVLDGHIVRGTDKNGCTVRGLHHIS